MNDEKLKAILLRLVEEIEHLRANLEVVAAVAGHQKGINTAAASNALNQAKSSSQPHYDKLRKDINEISS